MGFVSRYSRVATAHPCRLCLGQWSVILCLTAVVQFAGWLAIDEAVSAEWAITDELTTERSDAYNNAVSTEGLNFETNLDGAPTNRTSSNAVDSLSFMYDAGQDGNVFSPANLRRICELEQVVFKDETYKDFCVLNNVGGQCAEQTASVTWFFYGTTLPDCAVELTQAEVNLRVSSLQLGILSTSELGQALKFFVSSDYVPSDYVPKDDPTGSERNTWVNIRTRSLINFGTPIEVDRLPSKGKGDVEAEELKYLRENLHAPMQERLFEELDMKATWLYSSPYESEPYLGGDREEGADKDDTIRVRFTSAAFGIIEFANIIAVDFTAVVFSVVFVHVFMTIHLGSLFMATVSLLQMLMSIPFSLFFYSTFLQIEYFSQMHILVIFLILGVGADDVFVYVDKWKQTDPDLPMQERVEQTIAHTLQAVFNTSFTTMVAFLSTAISPIMPISAFGFFACLCIFFNYVFCVTITPCVVLIWEQRYAGYSYSQVVCGCVRAAPTSRKARNNQVVKVNGPDDMDVVKRKYSTGGEPGLDITGAKGVPGFFHHTVAPFLNKRSYGGFKLNSMFIIAVGLVAFGFTLMSALSLEPPREQEQWFRPSHMYSDIARYAREGFAAGDSDKYIVLQFPIGIDTIDRNGYNKWTPGKNRGVAIYDTTLHDSLSTATGQRNFIKACEIIRTSECTLTGCKQGPQDSRYTFSNSSVVCFMEEYVEWLSSNSVNETELIDEVELPEGDDFIGNLTEFLTTTSEGKKLAKNVGFTESGPRRIQLAVIRAVGSLFNRQPNDVLVPYYDALTELIESEIRDLALADGGVDMFKTMYVTSPQFSWMITQEKLVAGLFNGLLICFPVVFAVLLFATSNILLASYATFTIVAVVAGVLGIAQWIGWALGTAETIASVIVIGFAVDYAVHLVHIYKLSSDRSDRGHRVDEALTRMGPTVLAGAITTFGSGAVMFICALQFFFKMAVLICLTIVLSALFAIGWLMALLAVVGPEGTTGDLAFLTSCMSRDVKTIDQSANTSDATDGEVVAWVDSKSDEDGRLPSMSI